MSVLAAKRRKPQPRLEVATYAEEVRTILMDLADKNFGVENIDYVVNERYVLGIEPDQNYSKYRYRMKQYKDKIYKTALLLEDNIRVANSIFPHNQSEYEQRRLYQDYALCNCKQLLTTLQSIITDYFPAVDINTYQQSNEVINREIELIKSWRQANNKLA